MKISVIVPVYNSEKYLRACLDSILSQTVQDLELILVDDGSADSSGKICDEYTEKDNRVTVIHKKNAGVSAARNDGLLAASGDWISFIDSDDTLEPDMYEMLLGLAGTYGGEIMHCGYKRLDESGNLVKEVSGTHQILIQEPAEAVDCMLTGHYFVGGLWNKLFRRECLRDLQFCTELKNNEDILFNALAFQNANKIVFADETKYCYYEHGTSACNQLDEEKKARDRSYAAEKMIAACRSDAMREAVQKWSFSAKSNLLRLLVFRTDSDQDERREIRAWLIENYPKTSGLERKTKINYYLMIYFPWLYRSIYRIYDRIRKPNWDVK